MKIIITGPLSNEQKLSLKVFGDVHAYGGKELINEVDFVKAIADKDVYVCGGFERATKTVIEAAHSLKLIVFRGADAGAYIDISAATARKIAVNNAPGANSQAVAEFAISMLLSAWKAIPYLQEGMKSQKWIENTSSNLEGKMLGIVGMGRIGSKVARIAHAGFGMQIGYYSRARKLDVERAIGAEFCPIGDLFKKADAISLHVPSSALSGRAHLLTGAELGQMKNGSILVNTSPANLVDPAALFRVLSIGSPLRCAAFDSFYKEGNEFYDSDEKNLLQLSSERFIVTPHVAWRTPETAQATFDVVVECLRRFPKGGPYPNMVNSMPPTA
jgi:lactate dehydrogenase-like 2-hydroxyacid dehydrogenase